MYRKPKQKLVLLLFRQYLYNLALLEDVELSIPIPGKDRGDAFHLAVATFHGMDFLVFWNFNHILSARVRAVIQEINTIRGISTPIICTPEELMEV